ncbi:hypothetical protein AB9L94_24995, partial [Escherichia coli]
DTAFIQYRLRVTLSGRLASFRASEAITVRDGLIWRINEYASLVHESGGGAQAGGDGRPPASRLGLSAKQLSLLARDLEHYFQQAQPYLDPDLDLTQVANATGYTRNQISYLLNQVLGLSFYQYVNQTRLQHLLGQLSGELPGRVDELAFAAGLAVNRGIVVDRSLRTSHANIYALCDCAEVDGLNLLYVMPLMACARALAQTLAG